MDHKKQLDHIEKLMTRSTRFLSLSGLSGVAAGIIAIMGAVLANNLISGYNSKYGVNDRVGGLAEEELIVQLAIIATFVLLLSAAAAFYFSNRRAKKMGATLFDQSAIQLLRAFFPAMASGAFFCVVLLYKGHYDMIIPSTLLFYGLALWNASKFTMNEIFYLGIIELPLGAVCMFFPEYGFYFWTLGFGVLHILYGVIMYQKYENKRI